MPPEGPATIDGSAGSMSELSIIIVSGQSGSGKTTALKTLEDIGFYCVDNLPVLLLPTFIELCTRSADALPLIALGVDIREGAFLREFLPIVGVLRDENFRIELLFLECSDSVLVHRFNATRRQHPLTKEGSIQDGITLERRMLADIKEHADRIIDTSELNVHQLRSMFEQYFFRLAHRAMVITFMSFGFKYGVPGDIDLLFDIRFLPNPYFVPELKELTGTDTRVSRYVLDNDTCREYLHKLIDFLEYQLPLFRQEGKTYLTAAVGCTGGRHRSVALVNRLQTHFTASDERVFAVHRDIDR